MLTANIFRFHSLSARVKVFLLSYCVLGERACRRLSQKSRRAFFWLRIPSWSKRYTGARLCRASAGPSWYEPCASSRYEHEHEYEYEYDSSVGVVCEPDAAAAGFVLEFCHGPRDRVVVRAERFKLEVKLEYRSHCWPCCV